MFFSSLVLMIVSLFLKYGKHFYRGFVEKSFSLKFFILFLSVIFISVIFSVDKSHSISVFFERYFYYFLIFLIGIFIPKNKKVLLCLSFSIILAAIVYCIGLIWDFSGSPDRILGSYWIFTNVLYYLMVFIAFSIIFSFCNLKSIRILAIFAFIIVYLCLLFHKARSGWLVVPINILFIFFIVKKRKFACLFVLLFVLMIFFMPSLKNRLPNSLNSRSYTTRVQLWQSSFDIWKDYPLVGSGVGTYENMVSEYLPEKGFNDKVKHGHAHSTYFEILSNTGLLGFFAYLILMGAFFFNGMRYFQKNKFCNKNISYLFLLSCFFFWCNCILLSASSTIIIIGIKGPFVFWFLMGVADSMMSERVSEDISFDDCEKS